jgi:hypothetical protein
VCDVSGKNPNVMFELGVRLAFDKPTIIVKDDKTSYSFDTSPIEHLVYPRDLRFSQIVEFKEKLTEKVRATFEKSTNDPKYTTFLKHFGEFKVAKLDQKEISGQEFILEELKNIRATLSRSGQLTAIALADERRRPADADVNLCMVGKSEEELKMLYDQALKNPSVREASIRPVGNHKHLCLELSSGAGVDLPSLAKTLNGRLRKSKLHAEPRKFRAVRTEN